MQFVHSGPVHLAPSLSSLQDSFTGRTFLSVAATGLVAVCAHISLPLPFTLVPLTLQTFAVILVGILLGPVAGFSSMVLYLAEGACGLPVFTPHGPGGVAQLLGPTAGYLFSYPLAATLAGFTVRAVKNISSGFAVGIIAGVAASLPIFILGASWLAHLLHLNIMTAWQLAVAPFLLGEAIKVTAAAGAFSTLQRWRQS